MSQRRTGSDTLKYVPKLIRNKLNLNQDSVIEYFQHNTLSQCAKKFKCSPITIKRLLRKNNINTSIHNNSDLAKNINSTKNQININIDLNDYYINQNLDTKTIAEILGVHYNTIRQRIRKLGLKKTAKDVTRSMMKRHYKHYGYAHPAQRPDVIAKTRKSAQKVKYKNLIFRSLRELTYALYLDKNNYEWHYEETSIPYVDSITGKWRKYIIDFTTIKDNKISWIEVKPNNNMIPIDKRIYASRRAENCNIEYRGLYDNEQNEGWQLLISGYNINEYEFLHNRPRSSSKQVSYYFKSKSELDTFMIPNGWNKHTIKTFSNNLIALRIRKQK